ncbi:MAG: E3 ubiquitin-protein ligase HRD1 [Amphiamblys sp. WSBS2006]|nr:MAG: E3 ubiquitin-protein ligase HRD1 [Amphiamblys sp. WSBS2006]
MIVPTGFALIGAANMLLLLFSMAHSYRVYGELYRSTVFFATNKNNILLLQILGVYLLLCCAVCFKGILLGELRIIERENLRKSMGDVFFDIFISFSIVRKEVTFLSLLFFLAAVLLGVVKGLMADRLELTEQRDILPRYFYHRAVLFFWTVGSACAFFLTANIPPRDSLFCFIFRSEVEALLLDTLQLFIRFAMSIVERKRPEWTAKSTVQIHLDVVFHLLRFFVHTKCLASFYRKRTMSLSLVKKCIVELKGTFDGAQSVRKFWQLLYQMRRKYPDATEAEIRESPTCLICRGEMETAKKLPCGHIFHFECIRMWIERQQFCPTCRAPIATRNVRAAPTQTEAAQGDTGEPEHIQLGGFAGGEPPDVLTEEQVERIVVRGVQAEGNTAQTEALRREVEELKGRVEELRRVIEEVKGVMEKEIEQLRRRVGELEKKDGVLTG